MGPQLDPTSDPLQGTAQGRTQRVPRISAGDGSLPKGPQLFGSIKPSSSLVFCMNGSPC
jgi:hypothetical protein